MKILIVFALFLVCTHSNAQEVFATAELENGGKIVLFTDKCNMNSRYAVIHNGYGMTKEACWIRNVGDTVMIRIGPGPYGTKTYSLKDFDVNPNLRGIH